MKYFVLTLAFAALSSAKLFCDNGVSQPGRSCCVETDDAVSSWYNARKGCGDPEGGDKVSCGMYNDKIA
ncbi:hypothetical protein BUE80_DR000011, partial [Diplocarpon rosae]